MTSEIGDDAVQAWIEQYRDEQQRAEAQHLANRDDLIEALGHACESAKRLRDTVYYGQAHARVNELLDQLVGL
jgi:hypothetical protein